MGRVSHGIGHLRCGDRSPDVRPRLGWWRGGSGGPGGAGVVVRAVVLRSKTVTHSTLFRRRCCPHGSSGARGRFNSDPRVSNRSTSPRARRLSTRISRRSSQRNHRLAMCRISSLSSKLTSTCTQGLYCPTTSIISLHTRYTLPTYPSTNTTSGICTLQNQNLPSVLSLDP